jgi:exodeoxyribonuclease V alpha subunit
LQLTIFSIIVSSKQTFSIRKIRSTIRENLFNQYHLWSITMDEQNLFNAKFDISPPIQAIDTRQEKLSGEIVRVLFVSEDETYSVIKIRTETGEKVTVTGAFSGAFEGQVIKLKGKWENHKEHGRQFRALQFSFELPVTAKGIERYLASGLISGIGEKRAKLIVSHFKEKTLDILSNHSARLLEIPGFGKKTLKSLQKSWKEHEDKRDIIVYFQGLGISLAYCQKIYKRFNADALNIVKNNPYKLAEEVTGIGFLKADNIAKNLGIQHNDIKRVCAGISYALGELAQAGHVCYPEKAFLEYAAELLEVNIPDVEQGLIQAHKNKNAAVDTIYDSGNNPKTGQLHPS